MIGRLALLVIGILYYVAPEYVWFDPFGRFREAFDLECPYTSFLIGSRFFGDIDHTDIRYMSEEPLRIEQRHNILIRLLEILVDKFDEADVQTWWLDCGSLLGWWRDGKIIEHDDDIDIGMLKQDVFKLLNVRLSQTTDYVLEINPNVIYDYRDAGNWVDARIVDKHSGVYIDIFCFSRFKDTQRYYSKWRNLDAFEFVNQPYAPFITLEELFPLQNVSFSGCQAKVPNSPIPVLQRYYGADLRPHSLREQPNISQIQFNVSCIFVVLVAFSLGIRAGLLIARKKV